MRVLKFLSFLKSFSGKINNHNFFLRRNVIIVLSVFITVIVLTALFPACKSDAVGPSYTYKYDFNVWYYSDSYYFTDTVYTSYYDVVMKDMTGGAGLPQYIKDNRIQITSPDLEIWVQCDNTEPGKRDALAYVQLWDTGSSGYDTIIINQQIPGMKFFGYFRKLLPSEYYVFEYAGFIGLKISVPDNYHAGITYSTAAGKKYGKGEYGSAPGDTLILKMFKCADQSPDQTPLAWKLKMKNVYKLFGERIPQTGFNLLLRAKQNLNSGQEYIKMIPASGGPKSLMEITSIDRFTNPTSNPPPDGLIDLIEGKTYMSETMDLIMPTLRPFSDDLMAAGVDTNYYFYEIYNARKLYVQTLPKTVYFMFTAYW